MAISSRNYGRLFWFHLPSLEADHLISGGGGGVEENMELNRLFFKLPEENALLHPRNNLFAGLIP